MLVELKIEVSEDLLADHIIGAIEGGIGYWAHKVREGDKGEIPKCSNNYPYYCNVQHPNWELKIWDSTGNVDGTDNPYVLTKEKLKSGLKVMAQKYPRHFRDFMDETGDCVTSDVYIQCCLFSEIIYG